MQEEKITSLAGLDHSGNWSIPGVLGAALSFAKLVFDPSTPSMRKVDDKEKKKQKNGKGMTTKKSGH